MDTQVYKIVDKIDAIKDGLNANFLERKNAVDMIVLSVISGKHSILIGGPGLAKTAVLKALADRIKGLKFFDFQMTPATGIDELLSCGCASAVSAEGVSTGKGADLGGSRNRQNQNKIGIDNCDIALIDEFFKGPHSTLNSLLSIMNERIIYYGNSEPVKIPLISLFASSNERPDKSSDSNLLPLYDRFLFRMEILPVRSEENFKKLLELKDGDIYGDNENMKKNEYYTGKEIAGAVGEDGRIGESGAAIGGERERGVACGCGAGDFLLRKDIDILSKTAENAEISADILNKMYLIREELKNKQVIVSDRRWRETVKILKTAAVLDKRSYVAIEDLKMIEPSLWTYYSDIRAVRNIVGRILK
ncbi:MAG: AAA family ATPase [Candidatus Acidulodesulfobacterium sp.]